MSDVEKPSPIDNGVGDNSSNSDVGRIVDPDAGLSEAEKKEVVSFPASGDIYHIAHCSPDANAQQERKLLWKLDLKLIPWVRASFLFIAKLPEYCSSN